jgi:dTDP-L-rhamnose 4-epimerase
LELILNILITGGAGFIGTHFAKKCIANGVDVTVYDSLSSQIHGSIAPKFDDRIRFIKGDVRDRSKLKSAMQGCDAVIHLAAETGTGQSMYEVSRYSEVNVGGTANLFDILINREATSVKKVVTASSRAVYGEGAYSCEIHGTVFPGARALADLRAAQFSPRCPSCARFIESIATPESAPIHPTSFYGISKQVQEQITLLFAETIGINGFALRYQNVYGPGQSLRNPYTGILAIFATQARENQPIFVFEDGEESRDFVYIDDVVNATWLCLQPKSTGVKAFNVGSGERISVAHVAESIVAFFGSNSVVTTTGQFRLGDIRHNLADNTCGADLLGYSPCIRFVDGLKQFLTWATTQEGAEIGAYERSLRELQDKALMG